MHIIGHGLKGQIETRLSDGLKEVKPGEVDTMIAAGMGGGLVIKILREGSRWWIRLSPASCSPSQRYIESAVTWRRTR